jgi:hypothetical protein
VGCLANSTYKLALESNHLPPQQGNNIYELVHCEIRPALLATSLSHVEDIAICPFIDVDPFRNRYAEVWKNR